MPVLRTPTTPTTGTATSRPNYTPGQPLESWMQQELARNPSYQLPRGWRLDGNGRVIRDTTIGFGSNFADIAGRAGSLAGRAAIAYGMGGAGVIPAAGYGAAEGALTAPEGQRGRGALIGGIAGAASGGGGLGVTGSTGGTVATTGTGGFWTELLKNPDTWKAIGGAIGSYAQAQAANRGAMTDTTVDRDSQRIAENANFENAVQGRSQIEIARKQDERAGTNDSYRNALRSALAMNMRDVSVNRPHGIPVIKFSGGARPSALGAQGKQAAQTMNDIALRRLLEGESYTDLPAPQRVNLSDLPEQSVAEKWLGPIGLGVTGAAAILNSRRQQPIVGQPPQPPGKIVGVPDDDQTALWG